MKARSAVFVLVVLAYGCEEEPPQMLDVRPTSEEKAQVRNPVEEISRALLDGSAEAKLEALSAILSLDSATRQQNKKTLQALLRHCLSGEDPALRKEAALVFMKMEDGLELLVGSLDLVPEGDEEVFGMATQAVEESLKSTDAKDRLRAVDLLTEIGKPAVGLLLKALSDSNADVRLGALDALWSIGPTSAGFSERVSALLEDSDPRVRQAAAAAVERQRAGREEQAEPKERALPRFEKRE